MAANVNSYISAGNAAVRKAVKARTALAKGKPRFDDIGKEQIKAAANEKVAAFRANAKVANAATDSITQVENTKTNIKRDKAIDAARGKARMAGKLAGGVAAMGIAGIRMGEKQKPNEMLGIYKGFMDKYKNRGSEIQGEMDALEEQMSNYKPSNSAGDSDTDTPTTDTTGTTGGSTTGSDTSGGGGGTDWKLGKLIRYAEGTAGADGYRTQFTGTTFDDMSKHPAQIRSSNGLSSDAAGAYQFLSTTWKSTADKLGLTDFSPASQDKGGRYLVEQRGVNPDTDYTNFDAFKADISKLAPEWASLPTASTGTSYYGQGGKSIEDLWNYYQKL